MRSLRRILLLAVAGLCLVGSVAGAAEDMVRLGGGDKVLWLLEYDGASNTLVVGTRFHDQWQPVGQKLKGQPAAAAASGDRLHVFFVNGGYSYFDRVASSSNSGIWPQQWKGQTPLAAACSLAGEVVVLMPLQAKPPGPSEPSPVQPPAQPSPPVQPAEESEPVQTVAVMEAQIARPTLYVLRDRRWQRLADLPDEMLTGLSDDSRILMEADRRGLALVTVSSAGKAMFLARLGVEQPATQPTTAQSALASWQAVQPVSWQDSDGQARWLVRCGQELLLAGLADSNGVSSVWFRPVQGDSLGQPVTVRQDGTTLAIGAESSPWLAGYGQALALLWKEGDVWKLGTLGLDGRLGSVSSLQASQHRWLGVVKWVIVGLLVCLSAVWFLRQKAVARRPFALPAQMVASSWPKRMLAFLIDFFPLSMLSTWATGFKPESFQELQEMIQQAQRTGNVEAVLLPGLVSLAIYVVYAIITEYLTGATLGKRLLRMRVVGDLGQKPRFSDIVLRNVAKLVELSADAVTSFLPLTFVFIVWPVFTRYHQRFGDMVARTTVIDLHQRTQMIIPEEPE